MSAFSSPKVRFRSFSCYLPAALVKINPIHDEPIDEQRALQGRYEKEMAELRSLQKERKASEQTAASKNESGFVFSTASVEHAFPPANQQARTAHNPPALLKTA